jgi:hypothetical protein
VTALQRVPGGRLGSIAPTYGAISQVAAHLLKSYRRNSGDKGVTQKKMKARQNQHEHVHLSSRH